MVGAIQVPTLGMNATRLEFYFKKAAERGTKVLALGEYVINHFFKELIKIPSSMIKEQTKTHLKILQKLSTEYNIIVLAPIIIVKKDNLYKKIVIINNNSIKYYTQQILINYPHWNEENFFSNKIIPLKNIFIFQLDGFNIGVMFGFEIHFDELFKFVKSNDIDILIIPTASTFGSKYRWQDLLCSRAFTNNCYILRVNRVGEYIEDGIVWDFYGESMLINPDGDIEMKLEDRESMLIEPIYKDEIKEAKISWGFYEHLKKRGEI